MERASGTNKTLIIQKIGSILDFVSRNGPVSSISKMSAELEIPRGTLHRLVNDLEEAQFLTRYENGYEIGWRVLSLAVHALNNRDMVEVARPFLQWLSRQTGLNTSLYVRVEECRMCVHRIEGASILRPAVKVGELLPLHAGASGRILTAWLEETQREALLRSSRGRFPEVVSTHDVAWWKKVREQGWVLSVGERDPELAALAVPLFDVSGMVVASLSVSGSTFQFSKQDPNDIAELVTECARKIRLQGR
ncbi:IclR family transcriptional regulator [Alicyclobacillus suci]|uniref:IclR family transcriptional regulator n=1 Tax=Alicyclobacillus suci TaxID=2816080 RepID=UPI001A8C4E61|nr:IclR family transcriptional regulator [Alicyclobacillus suci]